MSSWKFEAVADANAVTALLKQKKASKASVAAAGQEPDGKKFQVWYVNSGDDDNKWRFDGIDLDKPADTDADKVTAILKNAREYAVTFYGQDKKYYVWWLKK